MTDKERVLKKVHAVLEHDWKKFLSQSGPDPGADAE